jgi:hypothetical protein
MWLEEEAVFLPSMVATGYLVGAISLHLPMVLMSVWFGYVR